MSKRDVLDFITSRDKWASVSVPAGLKEQIILEVRKAGLRKKLLFMRLVRTVAASAFLAAVLITGGQIYRLAGGINTVITYPYNGEKVMEIAGSFNNWSERIPMKLDQRLKVWKVEFKLKRGTYEYQYVVEGLIYTVGNAERIVMDNLGGRKVLLNVI